MAEQNGTAPLPASGGSLDGRERFITRRAVLAGGAALPLLAAVPASRAVAAPSPLQIRPRSQWGGGLPPTGQLEVERRADVRFLLVHHTQEPGNNYGTGDVPDLLRGIYRYHTSATKGWPDVAYNFFVDRYGRVWEGRTGSLQAPVMASATGGSQGFAMLACFLGDHEAAPPTAAARSAMIRLLAYLADEYAIDTATGATAHFISRGSNRWPRGRRVTTPTISGHRDMSLTTCPGRYVYPDVRSRFPIEVSAARGLSAPRTRAGQQANPPTSGGGTPRPTGSPQAPRTPPTATATLPKPEPHSPGAAAATTAPRTPAAATSGAGPLGSGNTPIGAGSDRGGDTTSQVMGLGALVVAVTAAVAARVIGRRSSS